MAENKTIRAGELIFSELPFAHCFNYDHASSFCHACGSGESRTISKLYKCVNCKFAHYCSKKCQISDWPSHKWECMLMCADIVDRSDTRSPNIITDIRKSTEARMVLRFCVAMVEQQNDVSAMERVRNVESRRKSYKMTLHNIRVLLSSYPSESKLKPLQMYITCMLIFGIQFDNNPIDGLEPLFTRIFAIVITNQLALLDLRLNSIGASVHLRLSKYDHSCWPTAYPINYGVEARLYALVDVALLLHPVNGHTPSTTESIERWLLIRVRLCCMCRRPAGMEAEKHALVGGGECTDEEIDNEMKVSGQFSDAEHLLKHIDTVLKRKYEHTNKIIVDARQKCEKLAMAQRRNDILKKCSSELESAYRIIMPRERVISKLLSARNTPACNAER